MGISFGKATKSVLDFIFPPKCVLCGEIDNSSDYTYLCRKCFEDFKEIHEPFCTICGKPFPTENARSHECADCFKEKPRFTASFSAGVYTGKLEDAIKAFKYQKLRFMYKPLADFMIKCFMKKTDAPEFDVIVPVPLSLKKLRQRNFDQSYLLARELSKRTNTPLNFENLLKQKDTKPQVELSLKERKTNVEGSFAVNNLFAFEGKTVLLIDDVYTSGSTLNECARTLKKTGKAKEIYCLTVAKTVFS